MYDKEDERKIVRESKMTDDTSGLSASSYSKILQSRKDRIDVVNQLIKTIASLGRKFFNHKSNIAYVFEKNKRLYMKNEYNGAEMCLSTRYCHPSRMWHHGGTLWALVQDFKEYIITGKRKNGTNGYGGLYCPYWGYPEDDMEAIVTKAKELGYL